jgi:hypothetical protein
VINENRGAGVLFYHTACEAEFLPSWILIPKDVTPLYPDGVPRATDVAVKNDQATIMHSPIATPAAFKGRMNVD